MHVDNIHWISTSIEMSQYDTVWHTQTVRGDLETLLSIVKKSLERFSKGFRETSKAARRFDFLVS